jgi:Fe-S cluster assembly protein SufB
MGARALSADRLPERLLLRSAKSQMDRPKSLDEVDPKLIETYKKLAFRFRAEAACGRGGGRGVRFGLGCDNVQGEAHRGGVIFCPISERSAITRIW